MPTHFHPRQRLIQVAAAFTFFGSTGVIMSCAQADDSKNIAGSNLEITRKITPTYAFHTEKGNMSEPWVVIPTNDGAVVAGVGGKSGGAFAAYAAKVGKDGTVLWSHAVESKEKLNPAYAKPQYSCGVLMDDGSVFLGGTMPAADSIPRKPRTGILTHLSKSGEVLSDRLPMPSAMEHGSVEFVDAAHVGEIAIFLARVMNVIKSGSSEDSYWLIAIDKAGVTAWEKQVSIPGKHYVCADRLRLVTLKEEGVVIVSQDNVETLLFKVNPKGEVVAKTQFKGCPPIVRSSGQDAVLQVAWFSDGAPKIATFDKDLKEIRKETFKKWPAKEFFPTSIHRTPEGYFFAASDHGQPFMAFAKDAASDILKVGIGDKDTDARRDMVAYVRAAAPTGKPGEFMVAPDVKSHPILFVQAPVALHSVGASQDK